MNKIEKIIENVRVNKDKAVVYYTYKFDKIKLTPQNFLVTKTEIQEKLKEVNKNSKLAIKTAANRIKKFHQLELKKILKSWKYTTNGECIGQVIKPIETVGIYIPGGKYAFYPSTVLMTAIPARIAGVKKIIITTPPGNIIPEVLYAAYISKVDAIYRIGGVQGIAAIAFGTETIPKVDLIVGPGSYYVQEAKRILYGKVGIDLIAGPTELAIICDQTVNIDYVVNDMLAQAEHSSDSKIYLFCNSEQILKKIKSKIKSFISQNSQFVFTNCSLNSAIERINQIAPEHLQIIVKNTKKVLEKIKNASAIFIGKFTPSAVGDYLAGPSHVLPTGGTAKFSSGISVQTFLKRTNLIKFNYTALKKLSKSVITFANIENLKFHAKSIEVRLE